MNEQDRAYRDRDRLEDALWHDRTVTRSGAALLLVLAAAVVTIVVWRPWDPTPDELRDPIREAERLPGVVAVDVEHRESPQSTTTKFGPEPSEVEVSVRLDATLTPDDAAAEAESVHTLLVPAAEAVARDAVSVHLRVTAGEPEDVIGIAAGHPLELWYTAASGADDVADAFTIWQAGARRVHVSGGGSPVGVAVAAESLTEVAPDPVAGIRIEAADAAELVPLAELAAELERSVNLRVTDGSISFNGHNSVPHVDAVRLAVATASRPGVESVVFDNSWAPELSVRAAFPAESAKTHELRRWLEAHNYAASAGHPVAFTISEPGYATLTEGWVSAFGPPEPEPYSLPLPVGVDAWPDDESAPACTGTQLELRFGGSDAAAGARYAVLLARNVSDGPCAVEGSPEVIFRDEGGATQENIQLEPYRPGVIPARLVVPPGEQMLAPLQWRGMSTANDPNVTAAIDVIAVPGAEPVLLDVTEHQSSPTGLDILDGAQVRLGPWVQALEGGS